MKKFLIAIALVGLTAPLFAQTFNLGIKGGINSQQMTTDKFTGSSSYTLSNLRSDAKAGYHIGAFMRLGGKKLYLQPEIYYTVKKGASNLNLTSGTSEMTPYSQSFNMKSVQVPLLLGYKLIDLKLVSLRVFAGPAMSTILKDSQISLSSKGVAVDPSLYDPKNFKNNVWDFQTGGGVDVGNFVFDIRYDWGLSNISDSNITHLGFVNKGNALIFSLGIKFL